MWRGHTKIKFHKNIVSKEVPPWWGPTGKFFDFGGSRLAKTHSIYKRKAVAAASDICYKF